MSKPVTFTETEIPGVLLVESQLFRDTRGFFTEIYSRRTWEAAGFAETFVQDNLSCSRKGVLRGMHYQLDPHGIGKLVRVLSGAVFDVAVDLRRGSPTFARWIGRTLTADSSQALWIPIGFAHGFVALEDDSRVLYKCSGFYHPEAERSLAYNDPDLAIAWPIDAAIVSNKDAAAPRLTEAEYNFTYHGPGALP